MRSATRSLNSLRSRWKKTNDDSLIACSVNVTSRTVHGRKTLGAFYTQGDHSVERSNFLVAWCSGIVVRRLNDVTLH